MLAGAILDSTQTYRYSLWREWEPEAPRVGFVMLNPSRADAWVDDPTIRRCLGFARFWGYGSLEVVNLFAYRTANPRNLCQVPDPIGEENDFYLASLSQRVQRIIVAWGNWGTLYNRDRDAIALIATENVYGLGLTKLGNVRHPLYVRGDTMPIPYTALLSERYTGFDPSSVEPS
ncbi:DUF1643 domain-containing protein [Kovacikia minuta CCNUW1]|uniref:DUF1643 domain-containing protein n=1 Tax=Kovacikia minuta TaxID=2931930 RepID=UPI001CCD100D|nr:DUF1643 domain-containing protein [Kovacikia minuta]UBF25151.1 DUF1643 domain-containing protein [Kovacikia minuta CCNUW1]